MRIKWWRSLKHAPFNWVKWNLFNDSENPNNSLLRSKLQSGRTCSLLLQTKGTILYKGNTSMRQFKHLLKGQLGRSKSSLINLWPGFNQVLSQRRLSCRWSSARNIRRTPSHLNGPEASPTWWVKTMRSCTQARKSSLTSHLSEGATRVVKFRQREKALAQSQCKSTRTSRLASLRSKQPTW